MSLYIRSHKELETIPLKVENPSYIQFSLSVYLWQVKQSSFHAYGAYAGIKSHREYWLSP